MVFSEGAAIGISGCFAGVCVGGPEGRRCWRDEDRPPRRFPFWAFRDEELVFCWRVCGGREVDEATTGALVGAWALPEFTGCG